MGTLEDDLAALRRMWERRGAAAEPMRRRIDRGMTRPPRSAEERAWLDEHGGAGPFVEMPSPPEAVTRRYRQGSRSDPQPLL